MLDPKFKKKWVAALRSGDYEQGYGALFVDGGYCCLGVACSVLGLSGGEIEGAVMPNSVGVSLGLSREEENILSDANDIHDWSFDEIADYIEVML